MNKIGIIGGAGPLASALLYESLVRESYSQGRKVPEILLLNYPFVRGNTEATLLTQLGTCIDTLVENGCKASILACNTMHLLLQRLSVAALEFHSLPKLVLQEAKRHKSYRLLVLATQTTCCSGLYHDPECQILFPQKASSSW